MKTCDLSVDVGRFQIPEPHAGHDAVLDAAERAGKRLLILVGSADKELCEKNPMPASMRADMMRSSRPDAIVDVVQDVAGDDVAWSAQVDALIEKHLRSIGGSTAKIFHGRDSFAKHYATGKFELVDAGDVPNISATAVRDSITPENNASFRRGFILAVRMMSRLIDAQKR